MSCNLSVSLGQSQRASRLCSDLDLRPRQEPQRPDFAARRRAPSRPALAPSRLTSHRRAGPRTAAPDPAARRA